MNTETSTRRLATLALVAIGALVLLPTLLMAFGMLGAGVMGGAGPTVGMGPTSPAGGAWGDAGAAPVWPSVVAVAVRLAVLVALVALGYVVYRAVAGSGIERDRALDELRLAYARGDLTDEEYERRRDALERDA